MGDAQDIEMDGSSEYDEENTSQYNINNHGSKKYENEDHRRGKGSDNYTQNGANRGKKKNAGKILAQENSLQDKTLSVRELKKIKQQIERLEHQPGRTKKKLKQQIQEKKSIEQDLSPQDNQKKEQSQNQQAFQWDDTTKISSKQLDAQKEFQISINNAINGEVSAENNNISNSKIITNLEEQYNPKLIAPQQISKHNQSHNPIGIIITEDDSEESASCEQLDEVQKPIQMPNSNNYNNNNNNNNNQNILINRSTNSTGVLQQLPQTIISDKISPIKHNLIAVETTLKKKRKYERRNKEDNNNNNTISKQGSSDNSSLSIIQVISTTNEVKSSNKVSSRSGSATLIAPAISTNSNSSSAAIISLIPRKQAISIENTLSLVPSNVEQMSSHQSEETTKQEQISNTNNNTILVNLIKNNDEISGKTTNGNVSSVPFQSIKQDQGSIEGSQFSKIPTQVLQNTQNMTQNQNNIQQNKSEYINSNRADQISNLTLPVQSKSVILNEQISTLSSEYIEMKQQQKRKRSKLFREERIISQIEPLSQAFSQQSVENQPEKRLSEQKIDQFQTNQNGISSNLFQKLNQTHGLNGDKIINGLVLQNQENGNHNNDNNNVNISSTHDSSSTLLVKNFKKNEQELKPKIKRGPYQGGPYEDQPELFLSLNSYQNQLKLERENVTAKFFEANIKDQLYRNCSDKQSQEQQWSSQLSNSLSKMPFLPKQYSYMCPNPVFSPKGNKPLLVFKPSEKLSKGSQFGSTDSICSEILNNPGQEISKSRVVKAGNSSLLDQTILLQDAIAKKFKAQNFQEAIKDPFSPLLNDFAATYLDPSYCQKVLSDFNRHQRFNESLGNQDLDIEY